ncbi:hypothetical protein HpHA239_07180 [Helicobacter pylori]
MFNNDYYFIALFRYKSLKLLKFLNTIFFIFSHKDNLMSYSHGYFMDSAYIKHYLDGINLLDMRLSLLANQITPPPPN